MYISKVRLKNIRCFEDETIELGDSYQSLMVAGNNASGKSSILRSIALGLCDEASAGGLIRELPGDFIRKNSEEDAVIEIEFAKVNGIQWSILTRLELYEPLNFERVFQTYLKNGEPEHDWKKFPWEKLFVAGYGAGLRTDGTADYDQYFSGDAVYTLFKYSQTIQNPELAWRRLESTTDNQKLKEQINKEISKILHSILDLDDDSAVRLRPNGIFIVKESQEKSGSKPDEFELGSVGDGYRAITSLIIDLLSWQLLLQNKDTEDEDNWNPLSLERIEGIAIIDEIEKHLHPKLQRLVIKTLVDTFPRIQFIISSHSPICIAGSADVEDKFNVYRTLSENGSNSIEKWEHGLSGMTTDQILEHFFHVPYINQGTLTDVENYSRLFLLGEEGRTDTDNDDLSRLKEKLEKSASSILQALEGKLIDAIIVEQMEKIEELKKGNND